MFGSHFGVGAAGQLLRSRLDVGKTNFDGIAEVALWRRPALILTTNS